VKKIVITGASGGLGSYIAKDFIENGYHVIGVCRSKPNVEGVEHLAVDLRQEQDLHFGDIPVINCSALTTDGQSPAVYNDNIAMTRNALTLNDGPYVQVSTTSVYNCTKDTVNVSEHEATGQYRYYNSYSRSKWQTELLVNEKARERSVILRPHALGGENDNTLIPRVKKQIRAGHIFLPRAGRAMHELTSFANFAQSCHLALRYLDKGFDPNIRTFNISDGKATMLRDGISFVLGDEAPKFHNIPGPIAWAVADLAERIAGPNREPAVTYYQIAQLIFDRSYNLTAAKEILGYDPTKAPLL